MGTMGKLRRTMYCGDIRKEHVGQEVVLMGWVQRSRNLGKLIFTDIRDIRGICQAVFHEDDAALFALAKDLKNEYVVAVRGVVRERSSKNTEIPTGEIEVEVSELIILDTAKTPPIYIKDGDNVNEEMRLKYRYLDLRKPEMQQKLINRSKLTKCIRDFYHEHNFHEIETPMLAKSTPEGARDYLVPSRLYEGKFYALPQSPQIFKQLLMVSGMDRYFQITKCFRDEDLRANRQPEFTQIDVEMSFVDEDDVLSIHEKLVKKLFKEMVKYDVPLPLHRMTYEEAMERFGVDKPDLRFGMELKNLNEILKDSSFNVFSNTVANGNVIRAINFDEGDALVSKKGMKKLEEFVKDYGAKGLIHVRYNEEKDSSIDKFLSEEEKDRIFSAMGSKEGDIVFIIADTFSTTSHALGNLRNHLAKMADVVDPNQYEVLWITDFPLFEYDEEEERYVAKHHPFTSPKMEDIDLLESNPEKVRSKAYDLVINGEEMGGGSIRINNSELQAKMFKALGFTKEKAQEQFGFLIEALSYGTPPHGGIAFGLDRMVQLFTNTPNIRDVIAFPKTQSAICLMTEAPSLVSADQLKEVHLKVDK
ncbi:MAG: aspartate--tRNA ligase [Tissierellia bacterium]|nr:aspartate--tRNA ligase [Tissierellia bacterium]